MAIPIASANLRISILEERNGEDGLGLPEKKYLLKSRHRGTLHVDSSEKIARNLF